ncbi:MAG: hemolysin III family protein [Chthoniobacterales bacterium]
MNVTDGTHPQTRWRQSLGEEIANGASHGVGLLAAAIGTPILLEAAWERGSISFVVGTAIFAATMLLLYLGSAVYHVWPRTRMKAALQVIDHSAIFFLIAGTYTPFALGPLRGIIGSLVLVLAWTLALLGVLMKTVKGVAHRPRFAVGLYLGMGWLCLLIIRPLAMAVPLVTLVWIFAGGVVYTAGVVFFINDHKRYCHFIWHLFVLGGTSCHYFAVLTYAGAS